MKSKVKIGKKTIKEQKKENLIQIQIQRMKKVLINELPSISMSGKINQRHEKKNLILAIARIRK